MQRATRGEEKKFERTSARALIMREYACLLRIGVYVYNCLIPPRYITGTLISFHLYESVLLINRCEVTRKRNLGSYFPYTSKRTYRDNNNSRQKRTNGFAFTLQAAQ